MVKLRILAAAITVLCLLPLDAQSNAAPSADAAGNNDRPSVDGAPDDGVPDSATKTDIQAVITKQLDALRRDDAAGAEEFAAPAIKQQFGEPAKFLDMVKEHYAALVNPKNTSFGETAGSPHGPLQKVIVVAADGTVWTAVYSFERVDGAWRITGVGLVKNEGQQDI